MIANVPDARFPAASAAEQVTVVVPMTNVEPDAGRHDASGDNGAVSAAVAVKLARAPPGPVASTVTGAGSVSDGGVTSTTTTEKLPEATLPVQSPAEHETVVVPIGNSCPENALHVMTFDGPDTASTAVTVKLTFAPALLVSSPWSSPGA